MSYRASKLLNRFYIGTLLALGFSFFACKQEPYNPDLLNTDFGDDTVNIAYRISSIDAYDAAGEETNIRFFIDTGIVWAWRQIEVASASGLRKFVPVYINGYLRSLQDEQSQEMVKINYVYNNIVARQLTKEIIVDRLQNPYAIVFKYDSGLLSKVEYRNYFPLSEQIGSQIIDSIVLCKGLNVSDCNDSSKAQYFYNGQKNALRNCRELLPIILVLSDWNSTDLYRMKGSLPLFFSQNVVIACNAPRLIEYEYALNNKFEYNYFYMKDPITKKLDGFAFSYFIK